MPNYRKSIAHFLLKERKVHIVSEISERIKCVICQNVICNAKQGPCGCHYCCECIETYLNGDTKYCPGKSPYCDEETITMNINIVDDFSTDREIRLLRFRCQNIGCTYEDEVRTMDDHYQSCPYGEEQCELCNVLLPRKDVNKHMEEECINRTVTCEFCQINLCYREMTEEHLNHKSNHFCKLYVSECPLKCKITDPLLVCQHLLVCANRPRQCPWVAVGCPINGHTKRDLSTHIKEHIFDHSKMLFDKFTVYKEELHSLKSRVATYENILNSFVWRIDNFSSLYDPHAKKQRLLSPVFSLLKFSYEAMMEIYIEDDNVKLYFAICQGQYDDILQWPFDRTVSISIMDQAGTNTHYKKTLNCALEPSCFIRCDGKRKGLGWEKFIDLNTLQSSGNLLKNDRLYIKCTVDI